MAESETKNPQAPTGEQKTNQPQGGSRSGAIESHRPGRQGYGMTRRGTYSPDLFLLSPAEIFSASPFELMRRFSEQMDSMFQDFGLSHASGSQAGQLGTWSPAVEVFQRDDNLIVRAELPGLNKEDVKVEVNDDALIIQGERKQEHEEKGKGFHRSERSYGHFYRVIPLPQDVDADQVRGEFNNGVLEITVPVPQSQQRRREIPIGAGSQQAQAASVKPTKS